MIDSEFKVIERQENPSYGRITLSLESYTVFTIKK